MKCATFISGLSVNFDDRMGNTKRKLPVFFAFRDTKGRRQVHYPGSLCFRGTQRRGQEQLGHLLRLSPPYVISPKSSSAYSRIADKAKHRMWHRNAKTSFDPRWEGGLEYKNAILQQKTFSALSRSIDRCAEKKRWFTKWPENVKIAYHMDGDIYVFRSYRQLRLPHGNTTSVNAPVFSLFAAHKVDDKRISAGFCAFRDTHGRRQARFC